MSKAGDAGVLDELSQMVDLVVLDVVEYFKKPVVMHLLVKPCVWLLANQLNDHTLF